MVKDGDCPYMSTYRRFYEPRGNDLSSFYVIFYELRGNDLSSFYVIFV